MGSTKRPLRTLTEMKARVRGKLCELQDQKEYTQKVIDQLVEKAKASAELLLAEHDKALFLSKYIAVKQLLESSIDKLLLVVTTCDEDEGDFSDCESEHTETPCLQIAPKQNEGSILDIDSTSSANSACIPKRLRMLSDEDVSRSAVVHNSQCPEPETEFYKDGNDGDDDPKGSELRSVSDSGVPDNDCRCSSASNGDSDEKTRPSTTASYSPVPSERSANDEVAVKMEKGDEIVEGTDEMIVALEQRSKKGARRTYAVQVATQQCAIPCVSLPEGTKVDVMLSHVNGPDDFWVVPCTSPDPLYEENILNYLYDEYQWKDSAIKIWVGDYCTAKRSSDKRWYRGQVSGVSTSLTCSGRLETQYDVRLIDVGVCERFPVSNVRPLALIFTIFPERAIPCSLSKADLCEDFYASSWITLGLKELASSCTFTMKVVQSSDAVHHVDLYFHHVIDGHQMEISVKEYLVLISRIERIKPMHPPLRHLMVKQVLSSYLRIDIADGDAADLDPREAPPTSIFPPLPTSPPPLPPPLPLQTPPQSPQQTSREPLPPPRPVPSSAAEVVETSKSTSASWSMGVAENSSPRSSHGQQRCGDRVFKTPSSRPPHRRRRSQAHGQYKEHSYNFSKFKLSRSEEDDADFEELAGPVVMEPDLDIDTRQEPEPIVTLSADGRTLRVCNSPPSTASNAENDVCDASTETSEVEVSRTCKRKKIRSHHRHSHGEESPNTTLTDSTVEGEGSNWLDPTLRIPYPEMSFRVHEESEVLLSHVVDPSNFYVQLFTDNVGADLLELDIKMNATHAGTLSPKLPRQHELASGTYCCAKSSIDGRWFRAKILGNCVTDDCDAQVTPSRKKKSQKKSTGFQVKVFNVDTGQNEQLDVEDLRPISPGFCEIPAQAHKCSLAYVTPVGTSDGIPVWSEEASKKMVELCGYENALVAVPVPSKITGISLLLWTSADGDSVLINEELVKLKFATSGAFGLEQVDIDVSPSVGSTQRNGVAPVEDPTARKALESWDPMKNDFHSDRNFYNVDVDDAVVAVSGYKPHDEERICIFYQRGQICRKGVTCAYKHIDPRVDQVTTDTEDVLCTFDFYELPAVGSYVVAVVMAIRDPGMFYVTFPSSESSDTDGVKFCNTDRFHHLWEAMQVDLQKIPRTKALVAFAPGQIVAARFSCDHAWYRARVIDTNVEVSQVKVCYVDYGNTEWVSEDDIQELSTRFMHLPFQAVQCTLSSVEPSPRNKLTSDPSWCEDSRDLFFDIVADNFLIAHVIDCVDENLHVELFSGKVSVDSNVGEMLISKGYAVPVKQLNSPQGIRED